ncbi:lipopolysaccharide biosynthesis protein [Roseimaritima sediminicola]|uniref:lipopolysaccharide biosynthesis protein n=1 Tax=Roseimaritima sediminicola TaxID=2662066 RepID=UPI00129849A9|nr:oligosaccharide flippase family protein [Roseimaritima sediminicola]
MSQNQAKPKSGVIRDTFAFGLQSVLPQLLSFALLPLFTSVLSPEDYAAVNLATVFGMLFSGVVAFQIPSIIGRLYFDCDKKNTSVFFSTVFIVAAVTIVTSLTILTTAGGHLVAIIFPSANLPFFPLFFLALISLGISSLASVCVSLLQVQKRATRLLRISVVTTCVHFAASVLLVVVLQWGPTGVLTATLISGSVNLALLAYTVSDHFAWAFDASFIAPGLHYCLPLILHYYGGFLFISSDKIVLEKFIPLAELGIYVVAVRLASPMSIFVEAFNRSNSPRFFEMSKKSRRATTYFYRDIITKWFAVMMVLWTGFSLLAGEAVQLLTPASYHPATSLLPILAGSYVFRGLYCFAANPLFFEMRTRWIPLITVSAGCLNIVLNILLVPTFGMAAAAWTTLASFATTFLAALLVGRVFYPMNWSVRSLAIIALLSLSVFAAFYYASIGSMPARIAAKLCGTAILAATLGIWLFLPKNAPTGLAHLSPNFLPALFRR